MYNPKFWIVLTHDVDRVKKAWWHSIYYFAKSKNPYHLKTLLNFSQENPYWDFEKIIQLEERYGVRSTFFFLDETKKLNLLDPKTYPLGLGHYKFRDPKVAEIIRRLDSEGWEIGLHGSYDSYLNRDLMKWEKEELEKILGKKVIGTRQHYLNLKIPETWEIQKSLGFKYDASFGFNRNVGWREDKFRLFRPFEDDKFFVIPLTVMDSALFQISKNVGRAWSIVLDLIKFAERNAAVMTVLWHQRVFNDREFPGWARIYEKIIIEGEKRGAKIINCREILEEVL